jgi:hypothetical protein
MMRRRGSAQFVKLVAALGFVAMAGPALAQPPATDTTVERLSETFSDALLCQNELYSITANGHVLTHFTAAGIDGDGNFVLPLHFHFLVHAKVVAVPLDGTGPTFTGHFRSSDSENIRDVKQGEVFVETDTDHNKVLMKGSDGSRVTLQEHHHFTENANGKTTVIFERVSASC